MKVSWPASSVAQLVTHLTTESLDGLTYLIIEGVLAGLIGGAIDDTAYLESLLTLEPAIGIGFLRPSVVFVKIAGDPVFNLSASLDLSYPIIQARLALTLTLPLILPACTNTDERPSHTQHIHVPHHTCTHACVHAYIRTCIHTHIRTYAHAYRSAAPSSSCTRA